MTINHNNNSDFSVAAVRMSHRFTNNNNKVVATTVAIEICHIIRSRLLLLVFKVRRHIHPEPMTISTKGRNSSHHYQFFQIISTTTTGDRCCRMKLDRPATTTTSR
jgi:hypothetical protein